MKILLAIDGSPHSEAAIVDVARGSWPDGTAIEILSVIPASALAIDPAIVMAAVYVEHIEERRRRSTMLVNAVRDRIEGDAWGVRVTTQIIEGNPRDVILDEARKWGADLILSFKRSIRPNTSTPSSPASKDRSSEESNTPHPCRLSREY